MKSMSDKEFDAFFKASLEEFEEEPTKDFWVAIESETNSSEPDSRKNKFPFLWAAASLILLGLGFVFFKSDAERVQLRSEKIEITNSQVEISETYSRPVNHPGFKPNNQAENEKRFLELMASTELEDKPVEKRRRYMENLPDRSAEIKERQLVKVVSNVIDKNQDTEKQEPEIKLQETLVQVDSPQETKERVRTLGDLVNFVVGKIDKRENKIIHVSKTDESDMEITGINLGLIKYRKAY
ncbi:hypothetical protein Pedsa_2363 [Pseudopedobacter saltans DSM 12145]|uniref:Uncharacterized protein n=1 Tax=Pseudopedobacter saltans (strain ATCC 51119 / DSM 12145 / JCM 21818 / CCUG 39354 / LMG 10337 / NBRC 100064 / NCIMB 13643) TaxID=762903 RepID=F0SDC5_PSESL|nr:hypothetical protein [Pseudopedobacter saltans]ADY52911.1 hypothetical protein Pedsa_2363 [Pseudopedobacter saltans DSM 12145]